MQALQRPVRVLGLLALTSLPLSASSPYDPAWASAAPSRVLTLSRDPSLSATQNGALLKAAIQALQPGDRLEIGPGTYSVASFFSIDLAGTAAQPIWIGARTDARPVITRPDNAQNTINVGSSGPARYLSIEGLEITGGDIALRLHDARHVRIDDCEIHHCAQNAVAANSHDTSYLTFTRNEIHHTAGYGEGLYLGANGSQFVTHHTVVARNHVHHTGGSQGDGIELKQGSWGNLIAENRVHNADYPCILVYGTDGNPPNVIERNVCYGSRDNVMQVQGEALVRNNLLVNGVVGFASSDHQGQTRDLVFVHNTIVNSGRATNLSSWNGRPGMVFANNVVYSKHAESIRFGSGSSGVVVSGNVVRGAVVGVNSGHVPGNGLSDFASVTWNGRRRNARPSAGSAILATGNPVWSEPIDITGAPRSGTLEAGCYDAP